MSMIDDTEDTEPAANRRVRFELYENSALAPAEWEERALCRQADPESFFPTKGRSGSRSAALRLCKSCEVRTACLKSALAVDWLMGIWGGTTKYQRDRMRGRRGGSGK